MAAATLALTGTLAVGSAMAYFTTYSTAGGGVKMNMGFTETVPKEDVDENGKYTPQGIYKLLSPAVVGITTYGEGGTFDPLGSATGIIISTDGYIVTNAHVVADAVEQRLHGGSEFMPSIRCINVVARS